MIYGLKFMENAQYLNSFLRFKFYTEANMLQSVFAENQIVVNLLRDLGFTLEDRIGKF